ncbi:MAG TPA: hypothetical protein VEA40_21225, partial [Ramlibacter sp.]|nr:hypothetical protein [Ramlibacter sp.]
MKFRIACLWLAAALALPAWAADDLRTAEMVDQARQWSRKGRDDLAAEIWRRLLIVVPNHPEALVSLGLIEARAGRMAEAQALLTRAQRANVPAARLRELTAAVQGANTAAQAQAAPSSSVSSTKPPPPPLPPLPPPPPQPSPPPAAVAVPKAPAPTPSA